jgi:hypothetical protein
LRLLNLDSSLNHGQCLLSASRPFVTEALDGTKGILSAPVTNKPPRRLGGEKDENQQRGLDWSVLWLWSVKRETHREDPLQGERYSPRPFIVLLVVTVGSGRDDNSTNGPAHLESSRASTSESERDNLAGISRRVRNEQAPRDTLQELANGEDGERLGLRMDSVRRDFNGGIANNSSTRQLTKKDTKMVAFMRIRDRMAVQR